MIAEPTAELELEGRVWTASVNGTELRVEEAGSGEQTVVFAPNPFTNRALYDAPVAALSGDYRCLRYDHRGQGESGFGSPQPSPDLLSTEGLYEDAVALLDELGLIPGDLDANGEVDFPDFLRLSANCGLSGVPYTQGDVDGNGEVAFPDFLQLSANYGKSVAGAAATVPEPGLGVFVLVLGTAMLTSRRRRRLESVREAEPSRSEAE